MYVPTHFAPDDEAVHELLAQPGAADLVRRLTEHHEGGRPDPWSVDDAPERYFAGQLRAIVGVEVAIQRIEAKFKLSQNRPDADIDGVVAGLRSVGDEPGASAVQAHRPDPRR